MRRVALVLVVCAGAFGLAAAGCGGEETVTASPDTVEGTTTTETTTTETTETETTDTETTTTETTETTETTPALEGDPVAGKEVFASAGCGGCHTLGAAGSSGAVGPNLDDAKPSAERVVDRVTNGKGVMPPFKGSLTEQQIADVAAFVSESAGT